MTGRNEAGETATEECSLPLIVNGSGALMQKLAFDYRQILEQE
jgi:hypothetical protein